jgi:small-conductance mechanosensitive channel
VATAVVGRPFLARVFPLAVRSLAAETVAHPVFDRTMGRLTVVLGTYYLLTSVWDIWLYNQTSPDRYLVIRTLVGWPAGFIVSCLGLWYADRALRAAPGFPGLLDLLDPEAGGDRG